MLGAWLAWKLFEHAGLDKAREYVSHDPMSVLSNIEREQIVSKITSEKDSKWPFFL